MTPKGAPFERWISEHARALDEESNAGRPVFALHFASRFGVSASNELYISLYVRRTIDYASYM